MNSYRAAEQKKSLKNATLRRRATNFATCAVFATGLTLLDKRRGYLIAIWRAPD